MNNSGLFNEYFKLCSGVNKIFVVPKFNFENRYTDYLYLLYQNYLSTSSKIKIESLSVYAHPKFFISRIFNEKIIVHYNWFECTDLKSLAGIFWKTFWLILYKLVGGKLVWTVHNKYPHTVKFVLVNKIMRKFLARLANKLHVHCNSAIDIMIPILKVNREKFFVCEHPKYPAKEIKKNEAEKALNDKYLSNFLKKNDKLFLMFGNIAEYKGIKDIIEIFNEFSQNTKLVVAGELKKGSDKYFNELIKLTENSKNVIIVDQRIPDEDIPLFFNRCDYSVFNFTNVLTSGGVSLALSYDKPVIIPAIGCLQEIGGKDVIKFSDKNELKNLLSNLC